MAFSAIPKVSHSLIKFGDAHFEQIQRHSQENALPSAEEQAEEQGDSWSKEAASKVEPLGKFRRPYANKISPEEVATLREAADEAQKAAEKIDPEYGKHMDLLHKAMTYSKEGTPFLLRDNGISSSKEIEHLIAIDGKQPSYNRFTIRAAKFQEDAHHLAKNFLQKIYDAVIEPFRAFFQKLKNLFGESEASRHEEAQLRDESGQHKMSTHHKAPTVEEVEDESFFKPAPETTAHAQNATHHARATKDEIKQAASTEKEMEEVKKSA
jgi:hypothetical protein